MNFTAKRIGCSQVPRLSAFMKKLILLIVFVSLLAWVAQFLVRSGNLFQEGIQKIEGKQNVGATLAFAELISRYPASPFVAVARAAMIQRDPANLITMDLFYSTRAKRDVFESIVGRSPAYYDPYFFWAVAYFLVISLLATAQRYWAGSKGLSFRSLTSRDTFALLLCVAYYFWVRGSLSVDTGVYRLAGSVSPWLNTPLGSTVVTLGFSAVITLANMIVTLLAAFTFLGSARKRSASASAN